MQHWNTDRIVLHFDESSDNDGTLLADFENQTVAWNEAMDTVNVAAPRLSIVSDTQHPAYHDTINEIGFVSDFEWQLMHSLPSAQDSRNAAATIRENEGKLTVEADIAFNPNKSIFDVDTVDVARSELGHVLGIHDTFDGHPTDELVSEYGTIDQPIESPTGCNQVGGDCFWLILIGLVIAKKFR